MSNVEKTRKYVKMVADQRGWALVTDEFFLNGLIEGLATNLERYGYRSCPCREAWEDKDRDVICPCVYAEPDIEEHGHCFCNLFFSKDYIAGGGQPKPIPERRPLEKIP
ncbi:MAG: ferredoxin-thioredoxin reductase catalytic domain-containing protein [Promethearchaeota archaeon]